MSIYPTIDERFSTMNIIYLSIMRFPNSFTYRRGSDDFQLGEGLLGELYEL